MILTETTLPCVPEHDANVIQPHGAQLWLFVPNLLKSEHLQGG